MNHKTIAFVIMLWALSAVHACGALVLYEGFNYSDGGNLTGNYGGSGMWTESWKAQGPSMTLVEGLFHAGAPSLGNAVADTSTSLGLANFRGWESADYTTDGSELWFSALFNTQTAGTTGGAELRIHPLGGSDLSAGSGVYVWGNNTVSVRIEGANSTEPRLDYDRGTTNLLVGRLDFSDTAGEDAIRVWLNPSLDTAPVTGGVGMTGNFNAMSTVYMRGGSTWIGMVDEFRMGTTFNSVVDDSTSETVGHWRFEGDGGSWLLDCSGNGRDLTAQGSPPQISLPASGPGSGFHNPILQTGQPNQSAVHLSGSGQWLTAPDHDVFTSNTFTIEAYVNIDTLDLGSTPIVASHFNSSVDERGWFFAISPDSGKLLLALSANGQTGTGNTEVITSNLTIEAEKDYYIAAAVNVADTSAEGITFYLQNLTDDGPLLSENRSHNLDELHNSTALFAIGAQGRTPSGNFFPGIIDEVRLSNVMLSPDQLLAVPEPSDCLLLLLSVLVLLPMRRRMPAACRARLRV